MKDGEAGGPERRAGRSIVSIPEAREAFDRLVADLGADRVAIVKNPSYIWSPVEFYPLPPRRSAIAQIRAVVMDMDGTTTTTEPVCIHSLEHMVRSITGWRDAAAWPGFDARRDLPNIIGNSTTRHVEYLVAAYAGGVRPDLFARRFLWTSAWTLASGRDPGRRTEVLADLAAFGVNELAGDPAFLAYGGGPAEAALPPAIERFAAPLALRFERAPFPDRVRAAVTIYYQRYHEILAGIGAGRGRELARQVLGAGASHLVAPMGPVAVFLSMVKGKLGRDGAAIDPILRGGDAGGSPSACGGARERFLALCEAFARRPAKVGIVTSSIRYEAEIVLGEVLRVIREQIASWPVRPDLKRELEELFRDTDSLYDARITATDSSEIRLKPHRDLYSIALQRLGLAVEDYPFVLGLEDSTSGVLALKAAGVGLCVAVPFEGTAHHDFCAADQVVRGGLAELILEHGCFVKGEGQ